MFADRDRRGTATRSEILRRIDETPAEEDALPKPFTQAAQEIANAEDRRERELREAEARARARRESAAIAAEEEERLQDFRRKSLRNAQNSRDAVDLMDAMHEADLRTEALRQSALIASDEERMLKELSRQAITQANADRDAAVSGVSMKPDAGIGSSFGFGTGAGDRLAEHRRQKELEAKRASLQVNVSRIGETDHAGGGF